MILANVAGAALIATGIAGIAFPEPLARGFGAPPADANGMKFVRASAVRDVALGAILLSASLNRARNVSIAASVSAIGVSLADFACTKKPVHLAGAALFAALLVRL